METKGCSRHDYHQRSGYDRDNDVLLTALEYARLGWPVLPLAPGRKIPATSHGVKDATTLESKIRKWFANHLDRGIGIACGEASGLLVIDVDPRNGGDDTFDELTTKLGALPDTVIQLTAGGGFHYLFSFPGAKGRGTLGAGVDIKSDGGYIVANPSVIYGRKYEWEANADPLDGVEVAELPEAWREAVLATSAADKPSGERTGGDECIDPATVTELRSALNYLDADDHETWTSCGHRLKSLGNVGRELWMTWSQTSAKWQPEDARRWDTFEGSRTGYQAIFAEAQRHGWVNPRSREARPPATKLANKAHDLCGHVANAHRIVEHYGDQLLYVEGIGWHIWGPPWRHDELGAVKMLQELGRIVAKEAADMAEWVSKAWDAIERDKRQTTMDRHFKWAGNCESRHTIEASLAMAAPHLAIKADQLDANSDLLGLPGGVLELTTGTYREHRRDDYITKLTGAGFEPDADANTWRRFVAEIMAGDSELIDYLQRLAGYILAGHRGEHLLPILWGSGANGKSVFVGTLQAVLGDYATSATPDLLIKKHGTDHPTALADLQGRRLVVVSETGEGRRLNEERAKLLTGGDRITARRMRQDYYEFAPTHQLLVQTNYQPIARGTDEGLWRRLRLIPFTVTIPPNKRDTQLLDKIKDELPGVLNWALEGLKKYQRERFRTPEAVTLATASYRTESDQIGRFIDDCCILAAHATATSRDLYDAYRKWCDESGERATSQRNFGSRLEERGLEQARSNVARKWRGIGVLSDASDVSDTFFGLSPTRDSTQEVYTENTNFASLASQCPRCAGEGCRFCESNLKPRRNP